MSFIATRYCGVPGLTSISIYPHPTTTYTFVCGNVIGTTDTCNAKCLPVTYPIWTLDEQINLISQFK